MIIITAAAAPLTGAAETPWNIYPLDPSNPLTLRIIKGVLTQIAEIFPSPYLHVGTSPCTAYVVGSIPSHTVYCRMLPHCRILLHTHIT